MSITLDQLEPGMSYNFSAVAVNIFGTSKVTISPVQIAANSYGKMLCVWLPMCTKNQSLNCPR